ncbi:MAG: RNA methyltransferase [bacterium]|nr:RNA methyltransferase [bacterium]
MEKITSAQNPLIKKLVRVSSSHSFRKKTNLTLLEGVHLAQEFLLKFGAPEICVVAADSKSPEVQEIVRKCLSKNIRVVEITSNLFSKISPVVDGIGILFLTEIPQNASFNPLAETLILDNLQDPGNLGTILRSAAAFGVEQIICSKGMVSVWSPKVLRAGMGAHFEIEIFENCDLKEQISKLEVPIFATSLEAEKSIFDEDLKPAKAWIFGNEGKGVSEELQNLADKKLKIPQNPRIESLNVAMAATVCLSESYRQRL